MLKIIYILPGALSMRRFLLLDIKQASIDKSCRQKTEGASESLSLSTLTWHYVGVYVWV